MKTIDILLQGEAIADVQLISVDEKGGVRAVQEAAERLRKDQGDSTDGEGEFHVFVQDEDEPLRAGKPLPKPRPGAPLCLHVHRCRKIKVAAAFNGKTEEALFSPGRTVGSVKTHVAVKIFGMDRSDAAEHVLQISGTTERPDADTHVGSLARNCAVTFDLVPLVRVEG